MFSLFHCHVFPNNAAYRNVDLTGNVLNIPTRTNEVRPKPQNQFSINQNYPLTLSFITPKGIMVNVQIIEVYSSLAGLWS